MQVEGHFPVNGTQIVKTGNRTGNEPGYMHDSDNLLHAGPDKFPSLR